MPVAIYAASDLPAVIDERQPTLSPPLREMFEQRRAREVEVSLPEVAGRLSRDSLVAVSRIEILGGSIFELETLTAPIQPLVGEEVRLGRLIAAVEAITRRYQEAGYPLSYAYLPSNNFRDGTVSVVIVEGYIARSEIAVDDAAVAARVERLVARMRAERPLSRETFERYTGLIERIPGVTLAVNAPVPRTPSGATTLRVEQRDRQRIDGGLTVEGGDEDEARLLANLAFRSHTPYAESLSFASLLPLETEDAFHAMEYRQALGSDGLRLILNAQRFEGEDASPHPRDEAIEVREDKVRDRFRFGVDYPLILGRERRWDLEATLEHLDETVDYAFVSDGQTALTARQDVRYSTLELGSRFLTGSDHRRLEARAEVRHGLDLGGNRNVVSVGNASAVGDEELDFTRFALQGRWLEALSPRWRLSMRLAGFWTDDDLPTAEHGNYGGNRFGRAYPDGQAEGERGYAGELELRYRHALDMAWLTRLEPYLAVDGAHTAFTEGDVEHDLGSAATGIEFRDEGRYRLGVEYAYPIGDRPEDDESRRGRINARLTWDFGG
ncbi:hemolysin activation/secretion protein [Halomonas beimenensis]|uniref:Hemolysin activation/secretion protein n=2 Tax=Halomonas beimenensis TaxID=475662 RepID=A0A291P8J1_9GAMM|nr:hemolysin activation/secretion protein [Halomonas beimenensis]